MARNNKRFKKSQHSTDDYIKANRRGSREAELELSNGFVSKHKIHQSSKAYNRREGKRIIFE